MNKTKQQILASDDPFISSILVLILDEYGPEALNWDPTTIQMELETDGRVHLSDNFLLKMGAAIQIMTTDNFYRSLPDFITLANIISGDLSSVNFWKPADEYTISSAVAQVRLLNPPEGNIMEAFDEEIIGYITVMLRSGGILTPPESLKFIPSDSLAVNDISTIQEDPVLLGVGYQAAQEASEDLQAFEDNVLRAMLQELQTLKLERGSLDALFQGRVT